MSHRDRRQAFLDRRNVKPEPAFGVPASQEIVTYGEKLPDMTKPTLLDHVLAAMAPNPAADLAAIRDITYWQWLQNGGPNRRMF